MPGTLGVLAGTSWYDYDRRAIWQQRITLSGTGSWKESSTWLLVVVTVLIGAVSPALYIMMIRLAVTIIATATRTAKDYFTKTAAEETASLIPQAGSTEASAFDDLWTILWSSRTPDGTIIQLVDFLFKRSRPAASRRWVVVLAFLAIFLILACLGFFICAAFVSIVSVGIFTDNAVLSSPPECGIWVAAGTAEQEATAYAKRCFGAIHGGTEGCSFFSIPAFEVSPIDHAPCPFAEDLCLQGPTSAYTLTTNLVPSKNLGINVPTGFLWNRTTTCVPLAKDKYIKLSDDGAQYEYFYGPNTDFGAPTWTSPVNQSWNFPEYSLQTVFYGQGLDFSAQNYWEPIPEFQPAENLLITLLFVQSQTNYYAGKRLDPIFPAQSGPIIFPEDGASLYYNGDTRATVLACVDKKEICHSSGAPCFPDIYDPPTEGYPSVEKDGYAMLLLSLMRSTVLDAVSLQGGSALDASSKLSGNRSILLDNEQWKVEARLAFEASVARMMITLRDIVSAAAAHEDGLKNERDAMLQNICGMFKYKANRWINVSVTGLVLLISSTVLTYLLGFDFGGSEYIGHLDPPTSNGNIGTRYGTVLPPHKNEDEDGTRPTKPSKLGIQYVSDSLIFLGRKGTEATVSLWARLFMLEG